MPNDLNRGTMAGGQHRLTLRVYYEDTDAGGVVYHANYLRFFERGRTEMLALLGIGDIAKLAGEGLIYVVGAAELRFLQPARLGDVLTVITKVEEVRGARCRVHHRVSRDGVGLVEGQIMLALVGPDGRPRPQPKHWIEALKAAAGADEQA